MAVAKRTSSKIQLSKNKKKGWKKYSNINDVEEYLEDQRFEEIIGPLSEKPSEEIFFLDKETKFNEIKKPNKKKEFLNNLSCFSALKNLSKILPPIQVNVIQPSSKKRIKRSKSKSKVNMEQNKQPKVIKSETKGKNDDIYDIWDSKVDNLSAETELDDDLIYYIKETTKSRQPKVPIHRYQKPSLLPAVEIPPAGTSYNPEYTDHTKLLLEVANAELKYEKDYNKIERALTEKFPTIDEAPTEKTWLEEMSVGLKTENTTETKDDEANEDNVISRNPSVRFDDKKSKQKRRREKELKEQLKEKKKIKLDNKRINEIYRLRNIKKDLINMEKRIEEKQIQKDKRLIERMYQPQTLSKYKYEAPAPEFNLSEEITGELRTIKVVGNILEDRYKSFQRRNIIEPRIRQKVKRKYKPKVFERK